MRTVTLDRAIAADEVLCHTPCGAAIGFSVWLEEGETHFEWPPPDARCPICGGLTTPSSCTYELALILAIPFLAGEKSGAA